MKSAAVKLCKPAALKLQNKGLSQPLISRRKDCGPLTLNKEVDLKMVSCLYMSGAHMTSKKGSSNKND